ncbi:MAG: endonuclease [Methylacidiphilales bacterium]|nr:endonuclease [Candidatus Methylacidiphilales bacterium]
MPTRPPRVCSCGRRVAAGERCECQRRRKAERDAARPSARARGYDTLYERLARAFLREHRICTCGQPATLVRHIIPISERPDLRLNPNNWLPGCPRCNANDHYRRKASKINSL